MVKYFKLLRSFLEVAGCLLFLGIASVSFASEPLQYNRDIRPILFDSCIACHGPDSASREADLRLDLREEAIDAGAIVPGDPESSELIRRIHAEDEAERMPPIETKKTLTVEQIETLSRWIREGAEYEPHWSFIPPVKPELPEVKNSWWVRNPIDHFVAARLESEGLAPASEADRRTLARRLSLDLTGLPPSPEVVEEFVNDSSKDAYENLVDQLLESPHWGEHRGRYWLDVARYADTHGIHFDNFREMWSYRDWVIDAFNKNMPFDEFTIENLAGDLLPNATLEQKIGSGFNRCNITTNEGGAISEEYNVLYARDRTETTAVTWMGLTAGCAVCHDHKFDPLKQREFYELSAFFNNTTQAAMDGNIKDTPPVVVVPQDEDQQRWDEVRDTLAQVRQDMDSRRQVARQEFDTWVVSGQRIEPENEMPQEGLQFHAAFDEGGEQFSYFVKGEKREISKPQNLVWRDGPTGKNAAYLEGGQILEVSEVGKFKKKQPFGVSLWIKVPANDGSGAVLARMEDGVRHQGWDLWLQGRRIGSHFIQKWPQNAIKVLTKKQLPADEWTHVSVVYDGSMKAAGFKIYINGLAQEVQVEADTLVHDESTHSDVPFKIGQRDKGAPISGVTLSDVRVYERELNSQDVTTLASRVIFAVLDKPIEDRKPAELDALYDWWLGNRDIQYPQLVQQNDALQREEQEIVARGTVAHIMQERDEAAAAFVLNRGEYDQRGEEVQPGTPAMLPPFDEDLPRNRLGLAKWLLDPAHPLTARVIVNRFWQDVFGTGLVKTSGDFGVSGQLPSHPELLDWLAVDFRESGWDVKRLFKQLVMSATYRQSAAITPEKLDRDPDNRLLSRGPRFRMDAEMVRDYALEASGLLVEKIGGPSVRPYQPPGVWEAVAMIGSNTRDYQQDEGDALYRRSMYTFWKRSAPPASMDIFNAPAREQCTTLRERTNTPLQALVTLNDPQFVEAARILASQALHQAGQQFNERVQWIAEKLLSRHFRDEELAVVQASYDQLSTHYESHAEEAKELIAVGESPTDETMPATELAAWTMTVNQLMNLDEVLNK
ncbi:DUF1553 domain-containing protein [Bythopirellula polymerisocia]|uniref:Planctomycete cytochrome C n=1 Tax=Bythopirellula polymerisocia TaxID=2528003 RepID=A0A5C6CB40_9BACT|nr:DUF1553 domain-containing protein [Bythopirellula polymerisocia]TWU21973.1 Planctomycete cytochrome C [Bythopirellula polymerisocia]